MADKPCLKQRLLADEMQYGAFVMAPSPALVEMFGHGGFDFVIIDREHGAASLETLENCLRAAETAGIEALVRIPNGSPSEILSALDAGASGIVVPHVITVEQARSIAAAACYPPRGRRGLATTARAGRHGAVTLREHLERAQERILVIVQIEDAESLPSVRAIAATDGIDGCFIGPADLSMSLGVPGEMDNPRLVEAIDGALAEIAAVDGALAAAFAPNRDAVRVLGTKGVRMICLSGTQIIANAIREASQSIRFT